MREAREERSRRVAAIKKGARTNNDGRSHLVPGLRACRLAAGTSSEKLYEELPRPPDAGRWWNEPPEDLSE